MVPQVLVCQGELALTRMTGARSVVSGSVVLVSAKSAMAVLSLTGSDLVLTGLELEPQSRWHGLERRML